MVHYIKSGDIFQLSEVSCYAHGCNCAGAMGKGIALQFRLRFPQMYEEYHNLCIQGKFLPGDVYTYTDGTITVFNLGTQKSWRTKATLEYIENALKKMLHKAESLHISSIALPAIGAGLGGLEWEEVKSVINKVSLESPEIDLVVVERFTK